MVRESLFDVDLANPCKRSERKTSNTTTSQYLLPTKDIIYGTSMRNVY